MEALARDRFELADDLIYLDGNSLGPLPRGVSQRMAEVIQTEWGASLIRGWNDHSWIGMPGRVGDRIARLIGAGLGTVMVTDSTSLNVAKVLSAAVDLRPQRRVVLSDSGNFPTDLYMAQGLLGARKTGHELRIVAPEEVEAAITDAGDDLAVVMLTHVDYRTGRMHDMPSVTAATHAAGALSLWDLAHSAGAVPVDLTGDDVDFAVGCTYKYLNGGPGSPGFAYAAPQHAATMTPLLSGWMGHASPFAFDLDYQPAEGVERLRVGTPPVLALSALDAALDVWDGIEMAAVREASVGLTTAFIEGVEDRCGDHDLQLVTPRDPARRGSQVSFAHPAAYAVVQALIADDVIGDFRAPDVMRFGFTPLYLGLAEVEEAVERLRTVLDERRWDRAAFKVRAAVT
ncbi:kynureninase [Euzebya tangerina]|uniref:kynureninase n=1 Tax=Euzebya tangerina TaxID=591198 RepID=UPI000E3222EF|nr:kynureninase [Euzebya tangerina]